MGFGGAQQRLIENGITYREYKIRFGAPCQQAIAAFRAADAKLNRVTLEVYKDDFELPIPLPRPPLNKAPTEQGDGWSAGLVALVYAAVVHGRLTKVSVAQTLTEITGREVTRYHVAKMIKRSKKVR